MKHLTQLETAAFNSEDLGLCEFVVATNIRSIFSEWYCLSGVPVLDSCVWRGISCDKNNITISLSLTSVQLVGSIPTSLSHLIGLKQLDLSDNFLYHKIPSEIGMLTNLEILNLGGNHLTSSIPSSLGYLRMLNSLSLYENFLTGSIPASFNNLSLLSSAFALYSNSLISTLPTFLGLLNTIQFDLHNNYFSSSIPTQLCMLSASLYMRLDNNRLTSSIPTCFVEIRFLNYLNLGHNLLTSTIPSSFANAKGLYFLFLNDNKLTGPPPVDLCDQLEFVQFYVANNKFNCNPYCQSDADWSGNTTHRCQDFQDKALYALENHLNIISALKRVINTETYTVTFSQGTKRYISYPGNRGKVGLTIST